MRFEDGKSVDFLRQNWIMVQCVILVIDDYGSCSSGFYKQFVDVWPKHADLKCKVFAMFSTWYLSWFQKHMKPGAFYM